MTFFVFKDIQRECNCLFKFTVEVADISLLSTCCYRHVLNNLKDVANFHCILSEIIHQEPSHQPKIWKEHNNPWLLDLMKEEQEECSLFLNLTP